MTPESFKEMMAKASRSARLANASNSELLSIFQDPKPVMTPGEKEAEAMKQMVSLGMRPTTDEAKLNKTETKYLHWLERQGDLWIGVQCITLKLGHDLRYAPDFWALDNEGLRAIDTKGGHTWEDSLIKVRIAARLFPFIRFVFATLDGEVWQHREFKP